MNDHYKFINKPLPYAYSSLEPYIDEKTMELHHDKHLQTYVDNLNQTLKDYPYLQNMTLEQLIYNAYRLPSQIRTPVIHNAGGVYNHQFFFDGMINSDIKRPVGMLSDAIDRTFRDYNNFKKDFKAAALSVFGSGYAWLVVDLNGNLSIVTTTNQGTPLTENLCPVLNIDVWEHAYYLKHYNLRTDYVDDWFQVVNWKMANENYLRCINALHREAYFIF